jgi:hypothetical protein
MVLSNVYILSKMLIVFGNTKITFYLDISGGQNYNLHLNLVNFFNDSVN